MLAKERLEESSQLLREYLVKCHRDKDDNSLYVRFAEILHEIERLQWDVESWERIGETVNKHRRE